MWKKQCPPEFRRAKEEYQEEGIYIEGFVPSELYTKVN